MVLRMCMILVNGGGAKAIQTFVSLNIAAISVSVVILLPAWPCPFYTPAELRVNSVIPVSLSTRFSFKQLVGK